MSHYHHAEFPPILGPVTLDRSPIPRPTVPSIASITTPEMQSAVPYSVSSQVTPPGSVPYAKKALAISNLMSPPESQPLDSFVRPHMGAAATSTMGKLAGALRDPLSPPISPLFGNGSSGEQAVAHNAIASDPILYPQTNSSPGSSHTPLFAGTSESKTTPITDTRRLIQEYIENRPAGMFTLTAPPEPEDYELMINFRAQIIKFYSCHPATLLRNVKQQHQADAKSRRKTSIKLARSMETPLLPARPQNVHKSGAGRVGPASRAAPVSRNAPTKAKAERVVKRSSPKPERRQAPVTREDKNYEALVDYCPPLESIPVDRPDCFKFEWKGTPINLSNDKLRHLLHEEELKLAAGLRLDCATYLTSKRRIFLKRVECSEIGKEFRKTDAQQACNIDVNKASRLHMAYEGIGWFHPKWITKFLEERKQMKAAGQPVPSSS